MASYIYPIFPAVALLLSLGYMYWGRRRCGNELIVACLLSFGAAAFFFVKRVFGPCEFAALSGLYLFYFALALVRNPFRRFAGYGIAAGIISVLVFADVRVVEQSFQPSGYFREIADYFRPQLLSKKPDEVVFTAPAYPAISFYTFHSGEYWETFYFRKSISAFIDDLQHGAQAFYIVDPSQALYGGKVSPEKVQVLRDYGVEVTAEIERALGHTIPLRVYVPQVSILKARNTVPHGSQTVGIIESKIQSSESKKTVKP